MKRTAVVLATFLIALALAPGALAVTQGGCDSFGRSQAGSLQIFENKIGDTGGGDDNWWVWCAPGTIPNGGIVIVDLNLVNIISGDCADNKPWTQTTWNDCADSAWVNLPSSLWVVCFYNDAGFSGGAAHLTGPKFGRYNIITILGADNASSIRLDNDGSC